MADRANVLIDQYNTKKLYFQKNIVNEDWDIDQLVRTITEPTFMEELWNSIYGPNPSAEEFLILRDFMQHRHYSLPIIPQSLLFETDVNEIEKHIEEKMNLD